MFKNWFKSRKNENDFIVFVLSDDPSASALIDSTLTEAGCTVKLATTTDDALQSLDERALPDVLIVDLYNPAIDGTTFIQQARHRFGKGALPPILVLMDSLEDETTAQQMEVNDVLPKPFETETLLAAIKALVDRTPPPKE